MAIEAINVKFSYKRKEVYSDLNLNIKTPQASRFYPNFNKAEFEKYLLDFNLDSSLDLSSASFGQKKKSIIAFSLATNVSYLLFDEPTNSLDIVSKNTFRNVLSSLNDRVIFITGHNVRDLTGVVDYLIIVGEKSILFSNSVSYINKNYKIKTISELNGNELYYEKNKDGFKALYFESSNGAEVVDIEFFFLYVTESKKER